MAKEESKTVKPKEKKVRKSKHLRKLKKNNNKRKGDPLENIEGEFFLSLEERKIIKFVSCLYINH